MVSGGACLYPWTGERIHYPGRRWSDGRRPTYRQSSAAGAHVAIAEVLPKRCRGRQDQLGVNLVPAIGGSCRIPQTALFDAVVAEDVLAVWQAKRCLVDALSGFSTPNSL